MSTIIIIMGVSGSGKSTIGKMLSEQTALPFYDADDYHPATNVAKMKSGQALTDHDRWPWLERLAVLLAKAEKEAGAILACSALKTSYRRVLEGSLSTSPALVYLDGSEELIAKRMQERTGHFMPVALLKSQFDTLEVPDNAIQVSIEQPANQMINQIVDRLQL